MVDEVQTGLGRTGRWFGFQHLGIEPDVVTMAKALGNGMPVGACWARAEVAAAFVPGDHGSTFGGQPLAMSAARATLAVMEAEDVPARAAGAGARLRAGLERLPGVASVRGEGLLLAAVLDRRVRRPGLSPRRLEAGLVVNAAAAGRPPVRSLPAGVRRRDRRGRRRSLGRVLAGLGPTPGAEGTGDDLDHRPSPTVHARRRPATCSTSTTSVRDGLADGPGPGRAGPGDLPRGARRPGRGPRVREAVEPHPQQHRDGGRGPRRAPGLHPGRRGRHGRAGDGRGRGPHPGLLPPRSSAPGSSTTPSLERMADALDDAGVAVPVVNLLSDLAHPCQALADLLTLRQRSGPSWPGPHRRLRRRRQQRVRGRWPWPPRWPGWPSGWPRPTATARSADDVALVAVARRRPDGDRPTRRGGRRRRRRLHRRVDLDGPGGRAEARRAAFAGFRSTRR